MEEKKDMGFKLDLPEGKKAEAFAATLMTSFGWVNIEFNDNNKFDIKAERYNSKTQEIEIRTVEVKSDLRCVPLNDTGNIFIETNSWDRNEGTGINVCEADWYYYIYKFLGQIWCIKTNKLKELIANNDFRIGVGGDEGSNSTGYLIPREDFREHFHVFDKHFITKYLNIDYKKFRYIYQ